MAEDWAPSLDSLPGSRFKWGSNSDTGAFTIWEVSGPGDGFPSHETYLATAWGRRPRAGDRLGTALVDDNSVSFIVFYGDDLPREATTWAANSYPNRQVRPTDGK